MSFEDLDWECGRGCLGGRGELARRADEHVDDCFGGLSAAGVVVCEVGDIEVLQGGALVRGHDVQLADWGV